MQLLVAITLISIAVVAGELQVKLGPYTPQGRIVGGREAPIESYPHQVLLEARGQGFCGGSIVSTRHVLPAAHCLVYPDEWVHVRAGTANRSLGGSLHRVVKSFKHEEYYIDEQYGIPINDIAIFEVCGPFPTDKTHKPIALFSSNEASSAGWPATITGWGSLSEGGRVSQVLRAATIPLIDARICDEAYKSFGGLPAGQICAAYYGESSKDACQGDSGGPLVIGGRQAGIVSWGNGCAKKGYPGVYTEVAKYREWIDGKITAGKQQLVAANSTEA